MAELSCSICLNVLRQPVTLPCGHEFCLSCLRDAIEKTSCDCPLCRHRLTCWIRTRRRGGEWDALVNHERWTEIQTSGKRVLRRKRRLDAAERSENEGKSECRGVMLASPGEIRKEYEEAVAKVEEEKCKEYEEGLTLARQLQTEELLASPCCKSPRQRSKRHKNRQEKEDLQLAESLQKEYDRLHFLMKQKGKTGEDIQRPNMRRTRQNSL